MSELNIHSIPEAHKQLIAAIEERKSVAAEIVQGKIEMYEILCKVFTDMVVVVTTQHTSLQEELKSIKSMISWASINQYISAE